MKVATQLDGSCRRVRGVDGHLEWWLGFAGVLFGNELARFVKCVYQELFVWD